MKKLNMIVDLSNLTYSTHHYLQKKYKDFNKNFLIYKTIMYVKSMALKFKPDGILIACDSPRVWRKDLYPDYKGNRDSLKDPYYDDVKEAMNEIKDFFNECTSIPALAVDKAEADDIIAVASQKSPHKTLIISADKDFIQLINDDVRLYSPTQKKERKSSDVGFDLFEKCIRGDRGDNIDSAYPRIRKVRLEAAWNDKTEMLNLMESTNKQGQKVSDVYKFNQRLIDLTKQPQFIKDDIETSINNINMGKYNTTMILRFIGTHELKELSKDFMRHNHVFKKQYII